VDRSWKYINRAQSDTHELGNWEQGRAVSFSVMHKSDLVWGVRSMRFSLY